MMKKEEEAKKLDEEETREGEMEFLSPTQRRVREAGRGLGLREKLKT